jgi:acetyl-CoA carboxylase carboxyl transferase subunit alpha|uniref:Acetyl-coenzyme A carboxylase carboxyl transferase subunit alpha n=1 Tax=candidate division WOR-3 bacterium TaxID=2052148 RepID=A0A7C3UQS1_UNCW3
MEKEYLEFEKPLKELEDKLKELEELGITDRRVSELKDAIKKTKEKIYRHLTPWQKVLLARHPSRPYTLDYITRICEDFIELAGDRRFGNDKAVVCGIGRISGERVCICGHQKGRTTKEKLERNFGMPHPEGYRKALRVMELGEKFNLPIITFIDTPGAFPGVGAEERGQAEAIARNLFVMARLSVPIVSVVIGEGGSGGALALSVSDRILALENAIYSVISPEGCASILWRDGSKAPDAAAVLKMTAPELKEFGLIDEIIPEPLGGAHQDFDEAALRVKEAILRNLSRLKEIPREELLKKRWEKFAKMGVFRE